MNFRHVFQTVFSVETMIAAGVFVVVFALLLYAVAFRRARAGKSPSRRVRNHPLELGYAVVLAGFVAFLVTWTVHANHSEQSQDTINAVTPEADQHPAVGVHVNAFQWCWAFDYEGHPVHVTGSCVTPGDRPTLVVPTGRRINLDITSDDVVHSFWIPALDVKKDAYPHHTNHLALTFDHPGRWLGRCAEFCGVHHTMMDFYVRAVPPKQYQQWLHAHAQGASR